MSVKIKGGAELAQFLEAIPLNLEKKVMRRAMLRGVNVIRDEARTRVRRQSGKTAMSIKSETDVKNGRIVAKVRLRGKHSHIGWFLEFGVAPHLISISYEANPRPGASIGTLNRMIKRGSLKINGQFVGASVMHPGFSPMPFLRPAADAKSQQAINAVGAYIHDYFRFGSLNAPLMSAEGDEE